MERDDQLAELLERWEDAIAAGQPLTPDDLCRNTPDLRHEFTQLLQNLGKVDPVLRGKVTVTESSNDEIDAGRYVAKSFHAKGGLGLVYLAEDTELRRSVALKWMQNLPAMDSRSRQRFMNEAEITGKLEHPGVALVYGAGRDPRGRPFYAMRFIHGETLSDEIRDFHSLHKHEYQSGEFARLLRKFVAVCQTVAYAHARGVIHRDIKPGNVMIGPYGETLLVDWGLAKIYNLADPEGTVDPGFAPLRLGVTSPEISLDGEVKGSPAYMSPEQARGEIALIGPRSDIYSLGAMMYVLLTGKSLYPGRNTEEIIHELTQRSPVINPDNDPVPKALLAICRKAMARIPVDRYENALFLADDIDRWLADEPVKVHKDGIAIRARRWVKNHRTLVASMAAMLLLSIVAMIIVIPILSGKNRELAQEIGLKEKANMLLAEESRATIDANEKLAKEIVAKEVAFKQVKEEKDKLSASFELNRGNFDLAERAIRSNSTLINHRFSGIADPVRMEVNAQTYQYYERFIEKNRGRTELSRELAYAYLKQGEASYYQALLDPTGKNGVEKAMSLYVEAEKRFDAILNEIPDDTLARYGAACTALTQAGVYVYQMKFTEAEKLILKACDIFVDLCERPRPELARHEGYESPAFQLAHSVILLRDSQKSSDPRSGLPLPRTVIPKSKIPNLELIERTDRILAREIDRQPDAAAEIGMFRGMLLMGLGEELVVRFNSEGFDKFRTARALLVQGLKKTPSAYEAETVIAMIDYYLALESRVVEKSKSREKMTDARDNFAKLASRDWSTDPGLLKVRVSMMAGGAAMTLAQWSIQDGDTRQAQKDLQLAYDLSVTDPKNDIGELSKRLWMIPILFEMAQTAQLCECDNTFVMKILERLKAHFKALERDLGQELWFRRERLQLESMIGTTLLAAADKRCLEILEVAVKGFAEFLKQNPDDDHARLQYGLCLMNHGIAMSVFREEYLASIPVLNLALEKLDSYPKGSSKDSTALKGKTQTLRVLALSHMGVIEKEMMAKEPNRKLVTIHLENGEAALKRLEMLRPLEMLEKQIRANLSQARKDLEKLPK